MIYAAPEAHGTRGTEAQPCSLARAQAHARRLAAAGHSVVVTLAGGRYELAAPLRFDARDSGVGDATVTYRAAGGERPVVTGASNVFLGIPDGLHTNRTPSGQPNSHLTAVNNYLSANAATEDLTRAPDSTSTNLVAVHEPNLPLEASRIIFESGLRDRAPQTFTATIGYTYRGVLFVATRTLKLTQLADE